MKLHFDLDFKDLEGNILDEYTFAGVTIHDVSITRDSTRMICVASSSPQTDTNLAEIGTVDRKEEMIMGE